MSDMAAKTIAERLGPVHAGLRADLEVTRQLFRGQSHYVVRDPLTFQTHQFSQYDYQILVAINHAESLEEVFHKLVEQGRLNADQEADYYQFVLTLHRLNYLLLPIADGKLLYERFAGKRRAERWRQISGFLFLRVPLINPDAFLDRTVGLVRPLFTRTACWLWLLLMLAGAGLLARRWDAFQHPVHSVLANETLLFIWVALIGLKVVHEFGHAYACKIFGGKVPEMGAFFIVFTPCAYMDASSAWGFPRLGHRVVVSLAGMYFESFVTLLALLLWLWTDDPLLSSCAHHVIILSSAVTIGFNINPLMRYDGYYVLSDITGIPNLRQRSVEQVQAVLKRILLGIRVPGSSSPLRVRVFLFVYGVAASIYKVTLVLAICTMIALKFYFVGVTLAAFFLLGVLVSSGRQLLLYLWRSPETRPVRGRAAVLSLVLLVLVPAGLASVPVPSRVVLPGVVRSKDGRTVFAPVAGMLQPAQLQPGTAVQAGEPICSLENELVDRAVRTSSAEASVARLELAASIQREPATSAVALVRWQHAQDRWLHDQQEHAQLTIHAPLTGLLTSVAGQGQAGRYLRKGEPVAEIAAGPWIVCCLATAEELAASNPQEGQTVRVRLQLDGVRELAGVIDHVGEKGSHHVAAPQLTQLGGGKITVDAANMNARQPLFQIDVRLRDVGDLQLQHEGSAMVLLASPSQTYGRYVYRRLRQFLSRLSVR